MTQLNMKTHVKLVGTVIKEQADWQNDSTFSINKSSLECEILCLVQYITTLLPDYRSLSDTQLSSALITLTLVFHSVIQREDMKNAILVAE